MFLLATYASFDKKITTHTMINEQLSLFFRGFRRDAHPMAIMVGVVGALSSFYHNNANTLALLTAFVNSLCFFCETKVILEGKIFPLSDIYFFSITIFL